MKRPASLRHRLLLLALLLLTVVWLLTSWVTWRDASHEVDELLDSHLAQAAALLVVQESREANEGYHHDQIDTPSLHRYAPQVVFQVWHDGELGLRSGTAPATRLSTLTDGFETRELAGVAWRIFAATGAQEDVQIYVGERIESRQHIAMTILYSTLWPLALALPLMAVGLWWAIRQALRPLDELHEALNQRDPHLLTPIELTHPAAEMQPVQQALNQLLARVNQLLMQERRFTADAAHELRTPVAAIRAQAQVALASADMAEQHEALLATIKGCDRAAYTIDQMLQLARLDSVSEHPTGQPADALAIFNLVDCAQDVAQTLQPTAQDRLQSLTLDTPVSCRVAGNSKRWSMLIRNLLDNSLRYSPRGATVVLRITTQHGQVQLTVEDSGPGLSEADMQRLGERFFRVAGTDTPGSGLGWSIIQRVAEVEGVQLAVSRSAHLGGLCVRLQCPVVPG
jgi:two-component system, OmpR family, sensor histidine kinase QseC